MTEFGRAFQWRIGLQSCCLHWSTLQAFSSSELPANSAGRQHQSRGRIRDLTPEGDDASIVSMTMGFALAKKVIGASAKWSDGWRDGIEERHGL